MSFVKSRAFSVLYMFILSALFAGVISAIKVATASKVEDNKKIAASRDLVEVFELMEVTSDTSGKILSETLEKQVSKLWAIEQAGTFTLSETDPGAGAAYFFWAAKNTDGELIAYAFPIGGKGFWGPVRGILAVEPDGVTIRTVVWTSHSETPGLGARIEEKPYREKFRGKLAVDPNKERFRVVPEGTMGNDPHAIDQITGATQTTVVGMGQFLNYNFEQWHKVYPLAKRRYAGKTAAIKIVKGKAQMTGASPIAKMKQLAEEKNAEKQD